MWDDGSLAEGYTGRFESYEELVNNSEPDIIYLNSSPEDELHDRVDWSLVHQRNLMDYGQIEEYDTIFIGPEKEITQLNNKLGPEKLSPTRALNETPNRLEEYRDLSENIGGAEEIHFIGSDYTTRKDQIIQEHTMPDIDAEFIGAKTNKNTSTERLKQRLYAEALRLSDRF